jgi:hypothetical protein
MFPQETGRVAPWTLAACFLALLGLGGCTVLGTVIGAVNDDGKPSRKTIPQEQTETIQPGSKVTVLLKTGGELTGKYSGLLRGPEEEYVKAFTAANRKLGEPLPNIGEQVVVSSTQSGELRGEFAGLDFQSLLVRVDPKEQPPARIPDSTILSLVGSDSTVLKSYVLRPLLSGEDVPLWSHIALAQSRSSTSSRLVTDTVLVAFGDVQQLQVHLKRGGAKKGFLIGLAIDATILAVAVIYVVADPNALYPGD